MTTTRTPSRERSATRRLLVLTLSDTAQKLRGSASSQRPALRAETIGVADALDALAARAGQGRGIAAGRLFQAATQAVVRAQMLLGEAGPVVTDILRSALDDLDCAAELMPRSGRAYLAPEALRGTVLDPQVHRTRPPARRERDDPYAA